MAAFFLNTVTPEPGPLATWDDFLADVTKLKAAGIVPLAIAGKDMWPSMHLWTYLALRIGGGDAMAQMVQSGNLNTDARTASLNPNLEELATTFRSGISQATRAADLENKQSLKHAAKGNP